MSEARSGTVIGVHRNGTHEFSKPSVDTVELHEGLGVYGDAHYGATVKHRSRVKRDPSTPNMRQVHLIHAELFDSLKEKGYAVAPGQLGENITTRGIALLDLPVGARLHIGDSAIVTVTGLRNPCQQINDFTPGLMKELVHLNESGDTVRLAGVMGIVSRSGEVRTDDSIRVELPPTPHFPLTTV